MTYCDMECSERKKVKKAFSFIRRETNKLEHIDCNKLKLAIKFPNLWFAYYKGIRKNAKYLIGKERILCPNQKAIIFLNVKKRTACRLIRV